MTTHFCLNCNSEIFTMPTEERSCCLQPNIIECDSSEIKYEQKTRMSNGIEIVYTAKSYVKGGNFKYFA